MLRSHVLPVLALLVLLCIAPLVFYPIFLIKLLCFALFAAAFHLLLGYVGLLSFGHAAFFGTGAYMCAQALARWNLAPELALLFAVAVSAALGAVIGFLAVRRQGIYFAMITLALGQMVYFIYLQAPFTGGEDGIRGITPGHFLGVVDLSNPLALYFTVLAVTTLAFALVRRIVQSPFGMILEAIRENEPRAISLGYNPTLYKLAAFTFSAALAGLAGGLKAMSFQIATLVDVTWQMSGEVVLMTLGGGIGTFLGPVVGAFIIGGLEQYLAQSALPAPVILGAAFILCVMLFRKGVAGTAKSLLQNRAPKRSTPDNPETQATNRIVK